MDTGRKLNIHKTFRIGPRRLLNVLCTVNLRFASRWSMHVLQNRVNTNMFEMKFKVSHPAPVNARN